MNGKGAAAAAAATAIGSHHQRMGARGGGRGGVVKIKTRKICIMKLFLLILTVVYLVGLLIIMNHPLSSLGDDDYRNESLWKYFLLTPTTTTISDFSWFLQEGDDDEIAAELAAENDDGAMTLGSGDNDNFDDDNIDEDGDKGEENEEENSDLEMGEEGSSAILTNTEQRRQRPTVKLPLPIMNVGFPKAGTSSIFEFFHCNGLKSQHWYCCDEQDTSSSTKRKILMSTCILHNLANNNPLLEDCGDFDVYAELNGPRTMYKQGQRRGVVLDDGTIDINPIGPRILLPQHHYLEQIHQQYPNATFILNQRPVVDWVESVMKWETSLKWEFGYEFYAQQQQQQTEKEQRWGTTKLSPPIPPPTITKSQLRNDVPTFLKWLYEYHNQFVRAFVAQHPSHTLIEIDISRNDTGELLGDMFGLDASCWGHVNKNMHGGRRGGRRRRRRGDGRLRHNGRHHRSPEQLQAIRSRLIMKRERKHQLLNQRYNQTSIMQQPLPLSSSSSNNKELQLREQYEAMVNNRQSSQTDSRIMERETIHKTHHRVKEHHNPRSHHKTRLGSNMGKHMDLKHRIKNRLRDRGQNLLKEEQEEQSFDSIDHGHYRGGNNNRVVPDNEPLFPGLPDRRRRQRKQHNNKNYDDSSSSSWNQQPISRMGKIKPWDLEEEK